jgi:hypothetical protein
MAEQVVRMARLYMKVPNCCRIQTRMAPAHKQGETSWTFEVDGRTCRAGKFPSWPDPATGGLKHPAPDT